MIVDFKGYFEVDNGQEDEVKELISNILFDLPFFIDIEFDVDDVL